MVAAAALMTLWGCAQRVEVTHRKQAAGSLPRAAVKGAQAPRWPPRWLLGAKIVGRVEDRSGAAVARAQVSLTLVQGATGRLPYVAWRTPRGRFRFTGLPPGAYHYTVCAAGKACARQWLWLEQGENPDLTVRLWPSSPVAGRVVDQQGRAVRGARVTVTPARGTPGVPRVAISDREGRFFADGLHHGVVQLKAEARGYRAAGRSRVTSPARKLRLRLTRLFRLQGRVQGAAAAQGAVVLLAGSGIWPGRQVAVSADGSFAVAGVPAGVYEVMARTTRAPWAASPVKEGIQVGPTAPAPLRLTLAPAQLVTGRVLHGQLPVAGATVVAGRANVSVLRAKTRTDARGRFKLGPMGPGDYHLAVWARGFLPVMDRTLSVPSASDLVLAVTRGATVRGVVRHGSGVALSGASIWIVYRVWPQQGPARTPGALGVVPGPVPPIPPVGAWSAEITTTAGPRTGTTTGAGGRFELTGLWPGQVRIIAGLKGQTQARSRWITLGPTSSVTLPADLVLLPAARLSGRVVNLGGHGLPGVRLVARGPGSDRLTAFCDSRGFYELDGLGLQVTLEVRARGFLPVELKLKLKRGTQQRDVVLEQAHGRLAGYLLDADRLPLRGALVRATRGPLKLEVRSRRSGYFELEGVGRAPVKLEVDHPDYLPLRRQGVRPGRDLELRLAWWTSVSGRVNDSHSGAPVPRLAARVTRGMVRGRTSVALTQPGAFSITGLAPGPVTLELTAPGYARRRLQLKLERPVRAGVRGASDQTVTLQRAGSITGRVLGANGRPLPGARVQAAGVTARADRRGMFRLGGVAEGARAVTVTHGKQTHRSDPVVVRADLVSGPVRIQLP